MSVLGRLGFIRLTDTAVVTPNFATTNAMVMETTSALTTQGVTTASFMVSARGYDIGSPSTDMIIVGAYVSRSTQGDVHCLLAKLSTLTVGASTATITYLISRT